MEKRDIILNADQLRKSLQSSAISRQMKKKVKRNEIYIVLDNVLDTYNIGSIFRLSDAVAAKKVYLCGGSETPPNHRIKKASINTTEVVEWEYAETAVEAINQIRKLLDSAPPPSKNTVRAQSRTTLQVISIEQSTKSVPYDHFEYTLPVCLVVGHESDGVSKEVLEISDAVVELPMFGINRSLNVMVSLGIVLYQVVENQKL